MNEAELTPRDCASRIGWAQVELESGVPLALALPALTECLHDSLHYFGAVELTGYQVTAVGVDTVAHWSSLVSMLNWVGGPSVCGEVTVGGAHGDVSDFLATLPGRNTDSYNFEAVDDALSGKVVTPEMSYLYPTDTPNFGLKAHLPASPSAAGWAMATVVNAVLTTTSRKTIRLSLEYTDGALWRHRPCETERAGHSVRPFLFSEIDVAVSVTEIAPFSMRPPFPRGLW